MRGKILIGLIIGAVIVVGFAYFKFFYKPKNSTQKVNDTEISGKENILQQVCQSAINDYPEWTKTASDIIIWENPDKKFYFRNAPEEPGTDIDSPAKDQEIILDMDFVGENMITYVTKSESLRIGTFKFELSGADNKTIYEMSEPAAFIDTSPLNEEEFFVFYVSDQAYLKDFDLKNSKEEIIFQTPSTKQAKISVSPKGTYIYLLQGDSLKMFSVSTKEKIYEEEAVLSAVWIGDSYLLFSNSEETYIYDIKGKEKNKIPKLTSTKELYFTPQSGGVIGYNLDTEGKIINCQNQEVLNSLQKGEIKALTSDKTAIISKENSMSYWRFFNSDWTVRLSEKFSHFATLWNRY